MDLRSSRKLIIISMVIGLLQDGEVSADVDMVGGHCGEDGVTCLG